MRSVLSLGFLVVTGAVGARSTVAETAKTAKTAGVCGVAGRGAATAFTMIERRSPSDTLATLTVCMLSDTSRLRIAGYHGEVTLSQSARIVRVERPAGGTRIENTTTRGRVSFAGVASDGLVSGPVLTLTLAHLGSADDGRVRLTMLDVTDLAGRNVGAQVRVDSMPRPTRRP